MMNKTATTLLSAVFCCCTLTTFRYVVAEEATPDNKSSELPMEALRDPFWPVGWQPPKFGKVMEEVDIQKTGLIRWDEAARQLKVTGISKYKDGYMAILQDIGVVEKGRVIEVNYLGLTYRWEIADITQNGISTKKIDVNPMK